MLILRHTSEKMSAPQGLFIFFINMMAGLEKPDEGEIYRGCKISFPLGFMGGVVGRHVIIVSHQAETLERFAKSAAVLKDGRIHMFDTLEEAKQLYDYETQG